MSVTPAEKIAYKMEMITSRLGYRPELMVPRLGMIMAWVPPPSLRRALPLGNRPSSFGLLSRLPPEIMDTILEQLDLQSLARLSQVSFTADGYVRSFRDYRYLVTHVPETLQALSNLGLTGVHSASDLYSTLRSSACAVCGDYGPFLFLPTCQRCCWGCWTYYPTFKIMQPSHAQKCYGLSDEKMAKLPVLRIPSLDILGTIDMPMPVRPKYSQAVSAKAARELALAEHGSEDKPTKGVMKQLTEFAMKKLAEFAMEKPSPVAAPKTCSSEIPLADARYWLAADKIPPRQHWLAPDKRTIDILPQPRACLRYNYDTLPPMPFPVLLTAGGGDNNGRPEQGLWCRGCQWVADNRHRINLDGVGSRLQPVLPLEYLTGEYDLETVAVGMSGQAWPKDIFLQHIRRCPGSRLFEPDLKKMEEEEWNQIVSASMKQ